MRTSALASFLAFAVAACGPATLGPVGGDPDDDPDGGSDTDSGPIGPPIPPPEDAAVYTHSPSALFRVDPDTLEVMPVGSFAWPGTADSMTDIAIDKNGKMIGVSFTRVYEVDPDTAEVVLLANLAGNTTFNGLSFLPGPDDDSPEQLIGTTGDGAVFRIDPGTGAASQVGSYGGVLGSSGDIVSVRGFGTMATVTGAGANDALARIDPVTFRATVVGDTGFRTIWGLGFWDDQIYGFTDAGDFLLIDAVTGNATAVESGAGQFWGAGVTTTAPVILREASN